VLGEFFTELSWKIMSHEIVPVPEPGSSAQSKGLQAFLDALPNLTEAELHALNHRWWSVYAGLRRRAGCCKWQISMLAIGFFFMTGTGSTLKGRSFA
jgi:hypothetical protein